MTIRWLRRLAAAFLTCLAAPTISWASLGTGFAWQKSGRLLAIISNDELHLVYDA